MREALRLLFFLPLGEDRPSGRWGPILALLAATVLIPQVEPFLDLGLEGHLNLLSLPGALLHIALIFVTAVAAALLAGRASEVPRILMAGLMVAVTMDTIGAAFDITADTEMAASLARLQWLAPLWLALAIAVYACRLAGPGVRRAAVAAACIGLLALPLATTWRDRTFWDEPAVPEAAEAAARLAAGSEEVIYRQPELLRQQLDALRPEREGVIDVFFVAMAGYGAQDVFRREVDSVSRIMGERFGTEGHAIRLVNNTKTLTEMPFATRTSLRASLRRIAQTMDLDEDILVLFMTSHGSEDHKLSLSLWPLRFDDLDPAALRSMLDESGIRNRVVIVSSCYSGGFVKALEGPDTLVITAAAADRTSFGCSNEAEWTYFGKAYFDEALRGTHSFVKAFEAAKPKVAERELREKFDPSDPQISAGAAISAKLRALEAQLDGR